jgi:tetratricopeptide (TPR) repeat protein
VVCATDFKRLILMIPPTAADRLHEAIRHRLNGDAEVAHRILGDLLEAYPNQPLLHYHLGWTLDVLERETEAVPHYEKAIELGLSGEDLRGALLGLGSTLRTLGRYEQAAAVLQRGLDTFGGDGGLEFAVFLAMVHYNLGQHRDAMRRLLRIIADTSTDPRVQSYQRAIRYYAEDLDRVW